MKVKFAALVLLCLAFMASGAFAMTPEAKEAEEGALEEGTGLWPDYTHQL
ncbi:MAG: hypothetical protein II948_08685 [Synergistaceae bacterium]|nr:hypothetical protein [Synergistaceae bacterium]MBQ6910244.1 hypothetical protein [Synergistaceae bacterium]MBQ7570165.1 hypothetical protein [Synergistaceae bacterium]MBQ9582029.1 hypothetical protein [Synergistaceae bacterium]MBQ9897565.1 hypothetical protein [Synergistaceae bacterium]